MHLGVGVAIEPEVWHDNQRDERDGGKRNDSHPSTRDRQEKEDPEESNAASKWDQQEDLDHPFKLESGVLLMAQDMQMMKEKMDMMMNAMKGWVSTNLDELVHQTNSPFTAQVTSCLLLAKFGMP